MSDADMASAARGTNASPMSPGFRAAFGGGPPPAAWTDAFPTSGSGVTARTAGVTNPPPVTNPGPGVASARPPSDVNSPGIQRLLDTGVPGGVPAKAPNNVAPAAVVAAAGTGRQVQTLHGKVSSIPGWQHDIIKAHPEIGKAGTQANADFVAAYKAAQASGQPMNPGQIAQNVMKNITAPAKPLEMSPDVAAAEIAAPVAPGGLLTAGVKPAATVEPPKFAGAPVGATQWNPIATPPPPATGIAAAGEGAGAATRKALPKVPGTLETAANIVTGAPMVLRGLHGLNEGARRGVQGFVKGFTGGGKPTPPPPGASPGATPWTPGESGTRSSTAAEEPSFPLTDPKKKKAATPFAATAFEF